MSKCPNCGSKLVEYDGHFLDQYCSNCNYEKDHSGRERNKDKNILVDY